MSKKKRRTVPNENHQVQYLKLPVKKLRADQPYQATRHYPATIKRIAREYDPRKVGVITVSERDGYYYVIDGKHRVSGIKLALGDDALVNCEVHTGLTYEDEARMFAEQYDNTRKLTPIQKLQGLYEAGDDEAVTIVTALSRHGLSASDEDGDGNIRCGGKLMSVFRSMNLAEFNEFLHIHTSIWHGARESLNIEIFGGFALFYRTYYKTFDRKRFAEKVGAVTIAEIIRDGNADISCKGDLRYAKKMWHLYNGKLSEARRLPYLFKG